MISEMRKPSGISTPSICTLKHRRKVPKLIGIPIVINTPFRYISSFPQCGNHKGILKFALTVNLTDTC